MWIMIDIVFLLFPVTPPSHTDLHNRNHQSKDHQFLLDSFQMYEILRANVVDDISFGPFSSLLLILQYLSIFFWHDVERMMVAEK